MSLQNSEGKPINRLLAALPQEDYQRLYPYLEPIALPQHKVLFHAGEDYKHAYFPSHAIVSSVAIMENGSLPQKLELLVMRAWWDCPSS